MLEALGNIGDFVGGLAVIATLVYLALQVRQNSQLLRNAAQESATAASHLTHGLAAQSPENAAVFHKGLIDLDSLSPEEQTHFFLLIMNVFMQMDYAYQSHKTGVLSATQWETQWIGVKWYLTRPGVRMWWQRRGHQVIGHSSGLVHLIEAEVEKHSKVAGQHELAVGQGNSKV